MQIQTGDILGNTTCVVTQNNQTVTAAVGSNWSQATAGSWFSVKGSGASYEIGGVSFSGGLWHLQLTGNYITVTNAAAEYVIHKDFGPSGEPIFNVGDNEVLTLLNRWSSKIGTRLTSSEGSIPGAVGDNVTDDSSAIATAAAAVSSAGGKLVFLAGKTYYINANITLPAKVHAIFERGANLRVAAGKTLTFNATFEAVAGQQIFSTTGNYVFGSNKRPGELCFAQWFGVVGDGNGTTGTDNYVALCNLNRFCFANDGMRVRFPTGIICTTNSFWFTSVRNAHLDFAGAVGQNIRADVSNYENFFLAIGASGAINRPIGATELGRLGPDFINSAAAGATTVTLKVLGNVSKYVAGAWVQVAGYEQQGNGFPFNFRFFEYRKIKTVNAGTGVITFEKPLLNSYDENWMPVSYPGYGTGVIGPAGIMPLDRANFGYFSEDITVENLKVLPNPNDAGETDFTGQFLRHSSKFTVSGCLKFTGRNITCEEAFAGEGEDHRFVSCNIDRVEPDKLLNKCRLERCVVGALLQGTGVDKVEVVSSQITNISGLYPRALFYEDCDFLYTTANPLGLPNGWCMRHLALRGNRFFLPAGSKEELFPGTTNQASTAPGSLSCVAVTTPTGTSFTTNATIDTYALRIWMDKGTVLRTTGGKRVVVTKITFDAVNTRFVVEYVGNRPVEVGDVLYYFRLQTLEALGNVKVNGSNRVPQSQQFAPAERYINTVDGIGLGAIDVTWADFIPANVNQYQLVDGFLQEIEVNIERPYGGAGDTRLAVSNYDPGGGAGLITINTTVVGRRRVFVAGTENPLSGDTLAALGSAYVHRIAIHTFASDNGAGPLGFIGTVRIKATKRY